MKAHTQRELCVLNHVFSKQEPNEYAASCISFPVFLKH